MRALLTPLTLVTGSGVIVALFVSSHVMPLPLDDSRVLGIGLGACLVLALAPHPVVVGGLLGLATGGCVVVSLAILPNDFGLAIGPVFTVFATALGFFLGSSAALVRAAVHELLTRLRHEPA